MNKTLPKISDLSPHLFWEYDISMLDWEKDKKLIIQRVLELWLGTDWEILKKTYGLDKIVEVAKNIKSLDDISANYLVIISDSSITNFAYYTQKQFLPHFTGY